VLLEAGNTANIQGDYTASGYLRVVTSPATPSTILVDGIPRNDWGLWAEVAPGSYEVCFGEVAGFDAPSCREVTVEAGTTGTTTGVFTPDGASTGPPPGFGYLRVTTSPAVGAMVTVDGHWGNNWGLDWVKLPAGSHEVCYGEAPSYTAPACVTIEVIAAGTTQVTGTYAPKGFLRVLTSPPVGATILVNGEVANAYGVWTGKPPGLYVVCFGPLHGHVTPPCQSGVSVSPASTTTVTGTYIPTAE
jgi:hypothetical protein